MKFVNFWTREIKQLSALERLYLMDAFGSLLSWDVLKTKYGELDLIRKMLESQLRFTEISAPEVQADKKWSWCVKELDVK